VTTRNTDSAPADSLQEQHIRVTVNDGVGNITLARPKKRNAMTRAMVRDLISALSGLSERADVDVIVLRGEGTAFCAGGDLSEAAEHGLDRESAGSLLALGAEKNGAIEESPKIVIASVDGAAHAGGLLLCLCADITIATSRARFRVPELLRGRPDPFIPPRLVRRVGIEHAKWMMFTAAEIDAQMAADWGLVSSVVPSFGLEAGVEALITAIRATDAESRTAWKRYVHELFTLNGSDQMELGHLFERQVVQDRSQRFFAPVDGTRE
jgi:enoyl-CoA hydratase/carnithine racemase